ncbi:MAG TPA: site-specific DNA-methyltransferase [Polyangiaceae bacterium]
MTARALTKNDAFVYGDRIAARHNKLFHGDNLPILHSLAQSHAGRFRAIYMDPPFNSGRQFAEYRDVWQRADWRSMMRDRLRAMRGLLADDGAMFVEIDDTELGSLLELVDGIYGPENRVSVVTIVRSAATGHKTINRGPVNVTDFLVIVAKDRAQWKPNALVRTREGRDPAYSLHLANPDDPPSAWHLSPLAHFVANQAGYESAKAATKAHGKARFEREIVRYSLAYPRNVARFAQPRFEAVGVEARALIQKSRAEPERTFVLERAGKKPFILRGGDRILSLADKVREVDGENRIVEPLTNIWDDIKFQGIAAEGGVRFPRNKKPEKLVERVIAMATDPGDAVLDPFLGSGTTAAVAHKMGRTYVGIESGAVLHDLSVPRLKRVVDGEDATGISRTYKWQGGGGFAVHSR